MRADPPDAAPHHHAPPGYTIRRRRPDDDAALVRVENAANQMLADHGYASLAEHGIPDVAFLRAMIADGDVFVADGPDGAPAGFAVARRLGARFHLRELSVDPAHGRRGLGAALVRCVVAHARASGAAGVSLTTFRDVPFNAPFYARLGFREIAEADPALTAAFLSEIPEGVDPAARMILVHDFGG